MPKSRIFFRRIIITIASLVLVAGYPLTAIADDPAAAPAAPQQGPVQPSGADAATYTYNADTGLWENAYYTWNPATGQTTPKTTQTYSYNPATGHWDTTDWIYDAAQGAYVPNVVSVDTPPAGALTVGGPTTGAAITDPTTQGPNSPVSGDSNSTGLFDNFYNSTISNTLNQDATSGNATIYQNTAAGGALTGNATDMATILNLLQSSTSLQGGITPFQMNINGDVNHDIVLDPSMFTSLSSVSTDNPSANSNLTINTQASGQINNDVNLAATTGDATVSQNTTAGDAATGDAAAIANIMNVINSVIGAGQSFVGTININGNLNGDILLPPDTLNSLLAASPTLTLGPNSPINSNSTNTLNANLTDTTGINNNLNLAAQSGKATVSNNTTAGSATTGPASTNITVLNLTGQSVIGSDALLVFVNVMGKWVGMIVNAPTGSTSAALCNCTSGPNSPAGTNSSSTTNVNETANNTINNNLNLRSTSGNATVSDNTTAGNAKTGKALASASLLNISMSSLSLSNWLGVLFINVFGSWNGSFGIDTAVGNPPVAGGIGGGPSVTEAVKSVKVFSFVPKAGSNSSFGIIPVVAVNNPTSSGDNNHSTVLAAITNKTPKTPVSHRGSLLWTAASLFFLIGVVGTEELIANRKAAQARFRKYLSSITVEPLKRY